MEGYRLTQLGTDDDGADCIGLISSKGKLAAEIRFKYEEEGLLISYLRVSTRMRRMGVGSELLQSVLDIIAMRGIFTPVECSFVREEIPEAELFFEVQPNFNVTHDSHLFRLTAEARKDNRFWKRLIGRSEKVSYFFEQDKKLRDAFIKKVDRNGFLDFIDEDESNYEEPLCLAGIKDDMIKAAIFFKKHPEKELELSFVYVDDDSRTMLMGLFCGAAEIIYHEYEDYDIWFSAVNPESHALVDHLIRADKSKLVERKTVCRASWTGWSIKEVEDIYRIAGSVEVS